ncbi:MAG: diaminopimelate dehydrogenase, partial [Evtepia sp.]
MLKIGIIGYGNLGKGVEAALSHTPDMELVAVFTRRDPNSLHIHSANVPVLPYDQFAEHDIDVMILCGGSATDLPGMTPEVAANCNVVDSFDNHADIPKHFAAVDAAAKQSGKLALISAGWDPGLFSINRLYGASILPNGSDDTFWGRG